MALPATSSLRRAVLAVCVLDDLDLEPGNEGVVLTGDVRVEVPWSECHTALADADPESTPGRDRLRRWLRTRRWLADQPLDALLEQVRPVGLPRDSVRHPGSGWVRSRVLGNALDLGLGLLGLDPAAPDEVDLQPVGLLEAAGLNPAAWWPGAANYLEAMVTLAAQRWERDPAAAIRPMGDCDVLTLLGSRSFRAALAERSGGMCPASVPMRTRGWTELRRVDPAFAVGAAAATEAVDRGFPRPLLITVDEVVLVPAGGRPELIDLRDPAPATAVLRDVRYR